MPCCVVGVTYLVVWRVLREPGCSLGHLPDPQRPLRALNPHEERVFLKIAARREQIAREIAEIEEQLLQTVKCRNF